VSFDGAGNYTFIALGAGNFRVREVSPSGYHLSTPSSGYYDVTLVMGQRLGGKNFADTQIIAASPPPPLPTPRQSVTDDSSLGTSDVIATLDDAGDALKRTRDLLPHV
jgi:hypothetical protein